MKIISRKSIVLLLVSVMLATLLAFGINLSTSRNALAADEGTDVSHYFYNQLKDEQKEFYRAMEVMNEQGLFIAGADYDLVVNGHVTQAQLDSFANGDQTILKVMAAARDAFYTDYNELFYVDFDYLSLRVTQGADGSYHAYLGSGRAETYYLKGFNSKASVEAAIAKYNAAIEAVVAETKAAKPTETQIAVFGEEAATKIAQMQYAHSWIAEHTIYKLEATCTPGNEGHVRTPYGVFVAKHDDGTQNKFLDNDQGEALCEGYSRAFKAIMDRIGIPCVLVNGVYRHAENQEELHMWCHVQLGDEWYAVDQTFDDINRRSGASGVLLTGLGNAYTEDYFLKGYSLMNTQHATSAYKSEAEYPFTYPELAYSNLGSEVSTEHGAMIRVEQEPYDAGMTSTNIKVSVFVEEKDEYGNGTGVGKWCSYSQAAKKGLYLVVRYEGNYLPEQLLRASGDLSDKKYDDYTDKDPFIGNTFLSWAYVNPIQGLYKGFIDDCDVENDEECIGYTMMRDTMKPNGYEFAVTTVAPRPYDKNETNLDRIAEMTSFLGDPTMFIARTGFIETLYKDPNYNPPPFIVKATPSSWGKLSIGKGPYNITVEYDQYLKLKDGDSDIHMSVVGMRATGEFVKGTNAIVLEKVVDLSTLTWDRGIGDNEHYTRGGRISFKFTPSPEYAHDNVMYYFSFNLVGENSGKQVNDIQYCAGYESDACCYKANGFHWSVYAQPQLIESGDLSMEGWKTSDGTDLSQTKSRLALVVTSPSKKQDSQMNDLLANALDMDQGDVADGGFESVTYNISLTICKGVSIETGQGVRIGIGFPEGFTYDDSMNGVMFKAYHFIRDRYNNVVDVEELEVTVTPLGLIITCYSFSPFAIVAMPGTMEETTDRTVIVTSTIGGTAYADVNGRKSNLFKVEDGKSRDLKIKANEGYVIESVKINDSVISITDESEMTLTLESGALSAQNVIDVKFVAKTVKQAEEARGEAAVTNPLRRAVIKTESKISVTEGETLKIDTTVTTYGDENVYQWFKDGIELAGQTADTLVIDKVKVRDAGTYTLKVTSTTGTNSVSSESMGIEVTVSEKSNDLMAYIIIGVVGGLIVVTLIAVVVIILKRRRA